MKVLGVDPGLSGAVAVMEDKKIIEIFDIPTFALKNAKGRSRRFIDEVRLLKLLKPHRGAVLALVERVWAMPKQGVASSFSFGRVFGQITMALSASGITQELVGAPHWKPLLDVPANKDAARARATELLAHASELWKLKKHDGRAEAALLAYLAWEIKNGRLENPSSRAA